jgi:hypothetical protein
MYNLYIFYTCVSHFSIMFGYVFLDTWGQGGVLNSFFYEVFLYNLPLVNHTIPFPLRIFAEAVDNLYYTNRKLTICIFFHFETNNLYNTRIVSKQFV